MGIGKLCQQGAKDGTAAPGPRLRRVLQVLDVGAEHPHLVIRGARDQDFVVRVPVDASDSRLQRLLYVLGEPPVVLQREVAYGYDFVPGANGDFVLCKRISESVLFARSDDVTIFQDQCVIKLVLK